MLESENQVENAATEDVSQTDIDDDVELMVSEARIRLKMQKTTFKIMTLQRDVNPAAVSITTSNEKLGSNDHKI